MKAVAGEGSPPGLGIKHAGLGIFRYELPCGAVWGHTCQFPGYQALGAAAPDEHAALAMMVNATNISKETDVAMVHAQQLVACRA